MKQIISKIKHFLKKDPVVLAMCDRYDQDPSILNDVEICFEDMPVSAKTKNKVIYINSSFLEDKSFSENIHYIVHELCHYLQQLTGDKHDLIKDYSEYLDIPAEVEAFMFQVEFMKNFYDFKTAESYVDDLLDFHDIVEDRAARRKILLGD